MLFLIALNKPAAPAHTSRDAPIPVPSPPSFPHIVFCVMTEWPLVEVVTLLNVPIESPSAVLQTDTKFENVAVVAPTGPPRNRSPSDPVPIFSAYPPLTESFVVPSPAMPKQCGFKLEFIRHMIRVKAPPGSPGLTLPAAVNICPTAAV